MKKIEIVTVEMLVEKFTEISRLLDLLQNQEDGEDVMRELSKLSDEKQKAKLSFLDIDDDERGMPPWTNIN